MVSKKPRKKYVFIRLAICCGDYEFGSSSVHELAAKEDEKAFAVECASTFYDDDEREEAAGSFSYFGGGIRVKIQSVTLVTKREYQVLSQYI